MAGWRQAIELAMSDEDVAELETICRSRSEPASRVERARILRAYWKDPAVLDDLLVVADHVALVEEDSIIAGKRMLYRRAGLIVEPPAALGIAAILEDPSRYTGQTGRDDHLRR